MDIYKSYLIQEVSVMYGMEYVNYIASDLLTALSFIAKVQSEHNNMCAHLRHFSEIYHITLSKSLTYEFTHDKDKLPVDDPIVGNFKIKFTTIPYTERVTYYTGNYFSPPICGNELYCKTCPRISTCIMKNRPECVYTSAPSSAFTTAKFISLMRPYASAVANRKKLGEIKKKVLKYLNNGYKHDFVYELNFKKGKFYMLNVYFMGEHGENITFNDEYFEKTKRRESMSKLYSLLNKDLFNMIKEDMEKWAM